MAAWDTAAAGPAAESTVAIPALALPRHITVLAAAAAAAAAAARTTAAQPSSAETVQRQLDHASALLGEF
jgi:hypothetical protein